MTMAGMVSFDTDNLLAFMFLGFLKEFTDPEDRKDTRPEGREGPAPFYCAQVKAMRELWSFKLRIHFIHLQEHDRNLLLQFAMEKKRGQAAGRRWCRAVVHSVICMPRLPLVLDWAVVALSWLAK